MKAKIWIGIVITGILAGMMIALFNSKPGNENQKKEPPDNLRVSSGSGSLQKDKPQVEKPGEEKKTGNKDKPPMELLFDQPKKPGEEKKTGNKDKPPMELLFDQPKKPGEEKKTGNADSIRELIHKAYDRQKNREWCEAEAGWNEVLEAIKNTGNAAGLDHLRREAEGNRELVKFLCEQKKKQILVSELKVDPLPKESLPEKFSKDTLLKFYREGHELKHYAMVTITGQGTNADWGIKGERYFTYRGLVAARTKVVKNDGETATFEIHFLSVQHTVEHSRARVELDLPDSKLAAFAWKGLGMKGPNLKILRNAAELVNVLDPNLRNTLTFIHNRLEDAGLAGGDKAEIIGKVDELQGHTIRLRYRNGIGVTFVEVVQDKLPPDLLSDLAETAEPLMDLFVYQAVDKRVGEKHKIRARDVAGLLPFGREAIATGSISLQRRTDKNPGKEAHLAAEESELIAEGRRRGAEQRGRVFVISGNIYYDLEKLHVTAARIQLKADSLFQSKDHLLFRLRSARNLEMQSTYESKSLSENKE